MEVHVFPKNGFQQPDQNRNGLVGGLAYTKTDN